jgi:hypothetical protein
MQWSEVKWSEVKWSEVKWSEAKQREVNCGDDVKGAKCSEVEWREGHGEMLMHQFMT